MEFDGDEVDIHLCAFKANGKVSDTRTCDKLNINTGHYLRCVAGNNAKSDITGFGTDPKGRAQFVYYDGGKWHLQLYQVVEMGRNYSFHQVLLQAIDVIPNSSLYKFR